LPGYSQRRSGTGRARQTSQTGQPLRSWHSPSGFQTSLANSYIIVLSGQIEFTNLRE
jgi:hypothetical protein